MCALYGRPMIVLTFLALFVDNQTRLQILCKCRSVSSLLQKKFLHIVRNNKHGRANEKDDWRVISVSDQ
jgi:hypothetical protein